MMHPAIRLLSLAPAIMLISAGLPSREYVRKCGTSIAPGGAPLVALDGVLRQGSADSVTRQLDRESILQIDVVCMSPQDSTFNRTHGIPVVSVWTTEGPVPQLRPALAAILAAQDAHFRRESKYFDKLGAVDLPPRPAQVKITMEAREGGWIDDRHDRPLLRQVLRIRR